MDGLKKVTSKDPSVSKKAVFKWQISLIRGAVMRIEVFLGAVSSSRPLIQTAYSTHFGGTMKFILLFVN